MSATLEAVWQEAQKLSPDEQQELAHKLLEKSQAGASEEKTLWQKIREHAAEVPDEVWRQMPADGAAQHDHYLYGSPKR
jgi:hypothetical protein